MQCFQETLTDSQWEYINKIVDNGRQRKTDLRMVVNAILWVTRTGAQWRNIDSSYRAKLPIILYYYYSWQKQGVWEDVLLYLVKEVRQELGDEASPSRVALDSQSVKSVPFVSQERGIDGNKRINGRKRHIVVDKHGFLLAVGVSAANCHDSPEGIELLWKLEQFERLELFCLDKAYKGRFLEALEIYGWQSEIGQKPESQQGFIPQNGRWQVERSFAWLNFYRRLSKDFEKTTASAVAFIQIAFINMILAKIHRLKT
jgi:transposase